MRNWSTLRFALLTVLIGLVPASPHDGALAAETVYKDSRGKEIVFPLGDLSFADEVVLFSPGNPGPAPNWAKADNALGAPDFKQCGPNAENPGCVSLGKHGQIVLRFLDNTLVDVDGPDLYVFEVGPTVEPTNLEISTDGKSWIDVGKIGGATAAIDIHPFVGAGEHFHYVRLTDMGNKSPAPYPGADIDAVGAIGAGMRISLKSSVLFDFDKAVIKPGAEAELHLAATQIRELHNPTTVVEGHTDNVDSVEYNEKLSEKRAQAVLTYLAGTEHLDQSRMKAIGYGKERPVATNATEAGREQNRRVELIIRPSR